MVSNGFFFPSSQDEIDRAFLSLQPLSFFLTLLKLLHLLDLAAISLHVSLLDSEKGEDREKEKEGRRKVEGTSGGSSKE